MASGQEPNEVTTSPCVKIFQCRPNQTESANLTNTIPQDVAVGGCSTANGSGKVQEHFHIELDVATEISILTLSALVLVCSSSALVVCSRRSQPALLIHFRSLRVCDLLISVFGASKMALVHNACKLLINFFMADSLFQTASLASCLTLVVLHGTLSLQLARPSRYAKLDEKSAKILAVLLWNTSLILGFLPLLLYHGDFTLSFFTFYSQAYLLVIGVSQAACLTASLILVALTPRFAKLHSEDKQSMRILSRQTRSVSTRTLAQESSGAGRQDSDCLGREVPVHQQSTRWCTLNTSSAIDSPGAIRVGRSSLLSSIGAATTTDNTIDTTAATELEASIRNAITEKSNPRLSEPTALSYHRWVRIETGLSLACSLPFLLYISLSCLNCPLGDRPLSDSAVLYFIPALLVRAMLGSALHLYITRRQRKARHDLGLLGNTDLSYTNPAFNEDDQNTQSLNVQQVGSSSGVPHGLQPLGSLRDSSEGRAPFCELFSYKPDLITHDINLES